MMNEQLINLTRNLKKNPGASLTAIEDAMAVLGVKPPPDYLEFLLESNGAEGFMPSGRYLMIHSVEQLVPCNEPYGLRESGPGLVGFGSDGGGMLYGFDTRHSPVTIVEVDANCMDLGPITLYGRTFVEFLEKFSVDQD